jgi:3-keto-5-aminohexanoate cleavage enzyme
MQKKIITCAITGAETTRQQNPNLPITPQEIADAACEAREAGAAILHLHVRNDDGSPTQSVAVFKEAIALIRRKTDIVIEITTGGAVGMSAEERMAPLVLEPEMASLDCGSVNFGDDYIINTLPIMRQFAAEMRKYKVRPTLECFDLSHIYSADILIKEKLIEPPFHYGLVLNVPAALPLNVHVLSDLLYRLPPEAYWTLIGVGRTSLSAVLSALAFGGFIRVGFEDSVYYEKGVLAKSNAELVARAFDLTRRAGMEVASPDDVRKMFKLRGA